MRYRIYYRKPGATGWNFWDCRDAVEAAAVRIILKSEGYIVQD